MPGGRLTALERRCLELVGTRPFAQIHEARPQKVL
jgi:hypothetical protein